VLVWFIFFDTNILFYFTNITNFRFVSNMQQLVCDLTMQELLDDINRLVPKLEDVERRVRFLSGGAGGRDAFGATVSVLYDRWDTVRMQATSKQNTVEVWLQLL